MSKRVKHTNTSNNAPNNTAQPNVDVDDADDETSYLTLEQYLTNVIIDIESNVGVGCVGHKSLMLWIDQNDTTIDWASLFWDIFEKVIPVVSPGQEHEFVDMFTTLQKLKNDFQSGHMSNKMQTQLHEAFIAWENALIDQHACRVGLEKMIEDRLHNNSQFGAKKEGPMAALSRIELLLNTDYDLVHPSREAAINVLEQILEIAFFADKETRDE